MMDLARKMKKTVEYANDGHTSCNWCSWYSHQRILKRNKRKRGDNPN